MLLGHIGIVQFEASQAHGAHVLHVLRRNPLENALGQRLGILEQAVDPRIVVGVEREGRGVDAAAAGRVGDDRTGRAVAGRTTFEQVQALLQRGDQLANTPAALGFLLAERALFGHEAGDQLLQLGDVVDPALLGDGVVGGHHQPDGGDFATATAAAVTAGG